MALLIDPAKRPPRILPALPDALFSAQGTVARQPLIDLEAWRGAGQLRRALASIFAGSGLLALITVTWLALERLG